MAANGLRTEKIWIDGALTPYDEANIHVLSHSLHYGLAVFEGMRCYKSDNGGSAIFRGPEHIRRLFDSAHIVEMQIPFSQEEVLKACCDVVRTTSIHLAGLHVQKACRVVPQACKMMPTASRALR